MAGERTNGSTAEFDGDASGVIDETGKFRVEDDGGDSIPLIEPTTIAYEPESGDDDTPRKRRGRKPGSRNTTTKASKQASADLTQLLMSLHFMAAALVKTPELILEQDEAKRLGEAINRVNDLYGGIVLSEKAQAWLNLGVAAGTIYGPRFIASSINKKNKKKNPVTIDAEVIN